MKIFNTYYYTKEHLNDFILQDNFKTSLESASSVLVQIYSGIIEKNKISKIVDEIENLIPNVVTIGATTSGEILNGIVSNKKIAISFNIFQDTKLSVKTYNKYNLESEKEIVKDIKKTIVKNNTKGILLHTGSYGYSTDKLLNAFTNELPEIPVFGGVAGDNSLYEKQYIFTNNEINEGIALVAMHSDILKINIDYHLNWQTIGKEFTITKVNENIVEEINNQPAVDIYKRYLGEDILKNLPSSGVEFPMIFKKNNVQVARVITKVINNYSLELESLVDVGDKFQLSYGHIESILNKGKEIVETIKEIPVETIWLFSCNARQSFLQEAAQLELNPFKKLPSSIGFFTYGEFYYKKNTCSLLLNDSIIIVALSEGEENVSASQIESANNEVVLAKESKQSLIFQGLNKLITTVTEELDQANKELISNNEEMKTLLTYLQERNNIIENLNKHTRDSIQYAQRIQKALLPTDELWNKHFPKSFILNMPKDIVSGDFYWIKQVCNKEYIAVADCTGHGVPGGFMSMLGISFLDEIVIEQQCKTTGEILNQLRDKIKKALNQAVGTQKDGMDISLCAINRELMQIEYSGAYNSLYLIRNKKDNYEIELDENRLKIEETDSHILYDIKANRQPIAIYRKEKSFDSSKINIKENDRFYMFSDGFVDQTGSDKGKKYLTKNFKKFLLTIQEKNMTEQYEELKNTINNWKKDQDQVDDILVVGVEI